MRRDHWLKKQTDAPRRHNMLKRLVGIIFVANLVQDKLGIRTH